jgi:redox-sensitive bicupin YhaK (pirin superfamily)
MGPYTFPAGRGVDVKPHPHINLATVTYLFEGEIVHRDSLGCVQTIKPGAINLMVAGGGIVHSERTDPALRVSEHTEDGLQLWMALPEQHEEIDPDFLHYAPGDLPLEEDGGIRIRVMIGSAYGLTSKVRTFSPTLYVEAEMRKGTDLDLPDTASEIAVYTVSGTAACDGVSMPPRSLILFSRGTRDSAPSGVAAGVRLSATDDSRIVIIGGEPLGRRYMWWNFVSSRKERIEQAKKDWREGRFGQVPGETEFYPLPSADTFSEREEKAAEESSE